MIGFGLILVAAAMMYMAMRMGAESPSSTLAAIRVKIDR